jgi:hypothetical protein
MPINRMFKRWTRIAGPDGRYGMLRAAGAALLLLAAGGAAPPRPPAPPPGFGRVIVREQIIVRITRGPSSAAFDTAAEWKERKGPRCVPARALVGAALSSQSSVDFLLRDGARIRARLQRRCPALDYYYGFYISPNPDGLVCADRDLIRSRVGGQCGIDKFRALEPR